MAAASNFFTCRYLVAWAILYLLFGLINIVFDHYCNWTDALAISAFVLTSIWGLFWFFRNHNRRAASVLLALPILWGCDFALTAIGVDAVQRSFWLTYPYYVFQIDEDKAKSFQWAESVWLLGGGWHYTLLYDPAEVNWNEFSSDAGSDRSYLIGTRNKTLALKTDAGDERREMRHLGGRWYFQSFENGEGLF